MSNKEIQRLIIDLSVEINDIAGSDDILRAQIVTNVQTMIERLSEISFKRLIKGIKQIDGENKCPVQY